MSKNMELTLRLNADGTAMIKSVKKADDALAGLGKSADIGTKKISKTRKGVESISTQLSRYNSIVKGMAVLAVGANVARQFFSTADAIKQTNARLRMATGSQHAFNAAVQQSRQIAKASRSNYLATVNLYSRLSTAANQYNIEQSKIASTTEAVTYGLKLYGASAAEVTSVQTQLSQALASGTLAGDEFKSMAEASPRLMQALADGLGVARGELKQMAADGKLTTEIVINALAGQADVLKAEFAEMPITVADAWGQLKNTMVIGVGAFDEFVGISDALANSLLWVSDNAGILASAASTLFGIFMSFLAARYVPMLFASMGVSAGAATVGISRLGLVMGAARAQMIAATVASRGLSIALSFVGGPIGLLIGSVAFLGYRYITTGKSADELAASHEYLADGMSETEYVAGLAAASIDLQKRAAEAARTKSVELTNQLIKETKAYYENAKAAVAAAAAKARLAYNDVESAYQYKRLGGGNGVLGFAASDGVLGENIEKRITKAKEKWQAATSHLNDLNEQQRTTQKLLDSLNAQSATLSADTGVALSNRVSAARDAIKVYTKEANMLKSAQQAGLITQAEYNQKISDAKGILEKTAGASQLLAQETKKTGRSAHRVSRAIKRLNEQKDEQKSAVNNFKSSQKKVLDNYQFEASLIGKQADEVERLRYAHELESAAKQAKQGLSVANQAVIAGEVTQLKQEYDLLVAQRKETEALQEQDWQGGLIAGLKDWQNQAGSLYDTMKNGSKNALDSMSNGLANFVATGKADFRSLTVSILADLSKMFIKASMMKMFGSLFSGFFSNGGVFGSSGQISFGIGQYALGGAFDGGVQYYANGDVFNRPTAFAHAGGLGVMGEAGPEAIMPLTRGAEGKLGVKMHGAASKSNTAGMVNHITIAVNVSDGNVDGDASSQKAQGRQLAENLDGAVRAVLAREIRPGGMLNNGR